MKPVILFAAASGVGKTTVMESVIAELSSRGYKVAAVKRTSHKVDPDRPGTDTWRFARAGAAVSILASPEGIGVFSRVEGSVELKEIINSYAANTDMVMVEGFKSLPYPKIIVSRAGKPDDITDTSDPLAIAFVADHPVDTALPVLDPDQPGAVADFLLNYLALDKKGY